MRLGATRASWISGGTARGSANRQPRGEFIFISGSRGRLDYNRFFFANSLREKLDGFDSKTGRAII